MHQQTTKSTETQKAIYKVSTFFLELIVALIVYAFAALVVSTVIIGGVLLLRFFLNPNLLPNIYSMTNFVFNHLRMNFLFIFCVVFYTLSAKSIFIFVKHLWHEMDTVSDDNSHW